MSPSLLTQPSLWELHTGSQGRPHKALSKPPRIFEGSDKVQEIDGIIELSVIKGDEPNGGASENTSKCAEDLCLAQDLSKSKSTVNRGMTVL